MTGIIDNKEFGEMLKKAFMSIVMFKINEHAQSNPSMKFYKIFKSELSQKELEGVKKLYDPFWG